MVAANKEQKKIMLHAIGFSSSCASAFLMDLCKLGSEPGMYRYPHLLRSCLEHFRLLILDMYSSKPTSKLVLRIFSIF